MLANAHSGLPSQMAGFIDGAAALFQACMEEKQKSGLHEFYEISTELPAQMLPALKTNEIPHPEAVSVALRFRKVAAEAVALLDAQLASREAQIKALKEEQEALRRRLIPARTKLSACDAVLAPIRRVPMDILREIARHSLPRYPTAASDYAPFTLLRVSSAWRSAVLSLPRLWTTLFVSVNDDSTLKHLGIKLGGWFQRARSLPLSFFLHFNYDVVYNQNILAFLATLTPIMARVHHFGLGGLHSPGLLAVFDFRIPRWDLTQLVKLDFFNLGTGGYPEEEDSDSEDEGPFPQLEVFRLTPNLREFAVRDRFPSAVSTKSIIRCGNLTSVVLDEGISVASWVDLMKICPQMRFCQTFIRDTDSEFSNLHQARSQSPKRVHNSLEDFHLILDYTYPSALEIVMLFDLPALHTLLLDHDDTPCDTSPSVTGSRNIRSLRSLTFGLGWIMKSDGLIQITLDVLREAVNLEHLAFEEGPLGFGSIFSAMSFTRQPVILPRLSSLHLRDPDIYSTLETPSCIPIILEAIDSRCRTSLPVNCNSLKQLRVSVSGPDRSPGKIQENLTLLQQHGQLELYVGHGTHGSKAQQSFDGWTPYLTNGGDFD